MSNPRRDRTTQMIRLIAALPLLTVIGLSSACTATADPPTPTTEPKSAEAARFPNMDNYAAANPDDYKTQYETPGRPGAKMTRYDFTTPDGIGCGFEQRPSASCAGNNLPSIAPVCDPPKRSYGGNEISTNTGLREVGIPCDGNASGKTLPPFHTLTVYGVTCGVDDKGTTACKDPQGRAFVLSPSWSGWIPKV